MFDIHLAAVLGIVARTSLVYIFMVVGIRLAGKREIGQLTPFDLVVLLLASNAVQNAMTGPDTSVPGGLVALATLLILNAFVSALRQRSLFFRRWVEGVPRVLVIHGEIVHRNLEQEHMTVDELTAALREHEVSELKEVEMAVLEIDGSVSVIRKDKGGDIKHTRRRLMRHHTRPNM